MQCSLYAPAGPAGNFAAEVRESALCAFALERRVDAGGDGPKKGGDENVAGGVIERQRRAALEEVGRNVVADLLHRPRAIMSGLAIIEEAVIDRWLDSPCHGRELGQLVISGCIHLPDGRRGR